MMRSSMNIALLMLGLLLVACAQVKPIDSNQTYAYTGGQISVINDERLCYMKLQGKIVPAMKGAFSQALSNLNQRACAEKILILSSHGGDLATAIEVGTQIRDAQLTTDMHGYCESACSFLYIAGAKRMVHADVSIQQECKLGVHQPTSELFLCQCIDLPKTSPLVVQKIKNYFAQMLSEQAREVLYQDMFATSCKQMAYLDVQYLLKNGIATEVASSQYR